MNKGDIILVPFPFSDLTGNKNRPALILIESEEDITVCFITTQLNLQSKYDIIVQPSEINRLKKTSLIRLSKIATLDKDLIMGRLGVLDARFNDLVNKNLIRLLKLK